MRLHVSSTCAHRQEVKIVLYSLWYHHTYRYDDTRGCIIHTASGIITPIYYTASGIITLIGMMIQEAV